MKLGLITFFILGIISSNVTAYEKADAFMVTLLERRIKVLSPNSFNSPQGIVIKNKTLVKVVGKFVDDNNKTIKFLAVESGETKSVELKFKKSRKIYFVPLAPSFQEVELVFGKKAYEVPPKK
ncbi:MAG: hypothetical protein KC493_01145 [Bacteriovoracaceae bacterium]|nr:hypothetical protein [Bacteriovoracaceae bacterium]